MKSLKNYAVFTLFHTLKLINTLGQVSLSQKVGFLTNKIDIYMLSNGIYNIILQDETGKIKYSSKIVKQNRE
jgi:hypothetical protein